MEINEDCENLITKEEHQDNHVINEKNKNNNENEDEIIMSFDDILTNKIKFGCYQYLSLFSLGILILSLKKL